MSEGPLMHMQTDIEKMKHDATITRKQIALQRESIEKSIKAIDHCLKVGRVAESIGFVLLLIGMVTMFLDWNTVSIITMILANVFIWGAVGYDSYMHHKDNKRQAEVDRQIKELEKQKGEAE